MDTRNTRVVAVHAEDARGGMMVVRSEALTEEIQRVEHSVGNTIIVRYLSGAVSFHSPEDMLDVVEGSL